MTEQKRDWKPGDVGIVPATGDRVFHMKGGRWFYDNGIPSSLNLADPDYKTRPLAVIDPKDPEQMSKLIKAVRDHYEAAGLGYLMAHQMFHDERVDTFAAALEEFANPTPPKPDEPQGLGAVAEDADGRLWVRVDMDEDFPWTSHHDDTATYFNWREIDAVRVLSEGVVQS